MNARYAFAALLATTLSAATSWSQTWSVDPNTGRPYAGTITTTTVTTYAPANQVTADYSPAPVYSPTVDLVPAYQASLAPVYVPQAAPTYETPAPAYAPQPAPVAEPMVALSLSAAPNVAAAGSVQQVAYYRPGYEHHDHVRPAYYAPAYAGVYARPAYYAAPYVAAPVPVYRPVAAAYAPVYAPAPVTTYAAPAPVYAAPQAASVPGGPKVWVHPKVYVQGEPVRNLIKAITP